MQRVALSTPNPPVLYLVTTHYLGVGPTTLPAKVVRRSFHANSLFQYLSDGPCFALLKPNGLDENKVAERSKVQSTGIQANEMQKIGKEPTITKLEKMLYSAKAHTTGGRENGASRTSDGRLGVKLSFLARRVACLKILRIIAAVFCETRR